MKITPEILEEVKKLYLEGNSIRETCNVLQNKFGIKITNEILRRKLKRLGLIRSNSVAQKLAKRKHLPIKEIIKFYSKEMMSLKKLAKIFKSNKLTIRKILEENGIKIRNNEEAIQLANTKHIKLPFDGNDCEKAYMLGLIKGDITPFPKSKFTLKLTSSSSRKAFIELFKNVFGKYGPTYIYVIKDNLSHYIWKITSELDLSSFNFLLSPQIDFLQKNKQLMLNYIAGIIDSDGSIFIRKTGKYFQYILRIYNEDLSLLQTIKDFLEKEKFAPNLYVFSKKGSSRKINGRTIVYNNNYYVIELSQREKVVKLIRLLPLKHPEKVLWKNKIEEIERRKVVFWSEIEKEVKSLRNYIYENYQKGLIEAESIFKRKYIIPLRSQQEQNELRASLSQLHR